MWSRLHHLLVNSARTQTQKHRGCHEGQSFKRGYYCTAAVDVVCTLAARLFWELQGSLGLYRPGPAPLRRIQLNDPLLRMSTFLFHWTTGNMAHTHTPKHRPWPSQRDLLMCTWLPQSRLFESWRDGVTALAERKAEALRLPWSWAARRCRTQSREKERARATYTHLYCLQKKTAMNIA